MVDLKLEDAIVFLFKERRWWLKFGIIFMLYYSVMALSTVLSIDDKQNLYGIYSGTGLLTNPAVVIAIAIVLLILAIFVTLLGGWYMYENTQSGIERRQTKLLWEYSLTTTVKRTIKLTLAGIIYGVMILIPLVLIIGLPIVIWSSLYSSVNSSTFFLIGLLLCCAIFILLLIISIVVFMYTTPAYLRLIASNTFGEAFKFRSNFKIAKKYFFSFVFVGGIAFVVGFILSIFSGMLSIFTSAVYLMHPVAGTILELIVQLPVTALMVYLSYFAYARLLGNMYRSIILKESELKHLR